MHPVLYIGLMMFSFAMGWGLVNIYKTAKYEGPRTVKAAIVAWLFMALVASGLVIAMPMQLTGGYVYGPFGMHPAYWNTLINWLVGLFVFATGVWVALPSNQIEG